MASDTRLVGVGSLSIVEALKNDAEDVRKMSVWFTKVAMGYSIVLYS